MDEIKVCRVCNQSKNMCEFPFSKPKGKYENRCKECRNEKQRRFRQTPKSKEWRKNYQQTEKYKEQSKECAQRPHHKKQARENQRKRRKIIKIQVISHYSKEQMKCCRCGFDDMRALSIDHIEGGGVKHRKSLNFIGGCAFYRWLVKNNLPTGYQVLCMNCQFIKRVENQECTPYID